jgi:hypothetical protein
MLKFYYNWRYKRAQRISSFELPNRSTSKRISLSSYLSQDTVRGRDFDRFDLPRKGKRWLKFVVLVTLAGLFIWLIYESIQAFAILRN